jgi:hypothetical protein
MAKYYRIRTRGDSPMDIRLNGCIGTIEADTPTHAHPLGVFLLAKRQEALNLSQSICILSGVHITSEDVFTEVQL